ncbi:MAG TPA: cystathionine beta-lyase, partial [Gammaproteobacteria bacterium]|nr:cystathionine beta-lyase [Gammaproteobacteria bacterium]
MAFLHLLLASSGRSPGSVAADRSPWCAQSPAARERGALILLPSGEPPVHDETALTHFGRDPARFDGVVNPPVYRASTVLFPNLAALEAASRQPFTGTYYGRFGTPTTFALEEAMAALEGAHRAVAVESGLAAITTTLLAFLEPGDHLLMVDTVYGPTRFFCDGLLARMGISTTYYASDSGADLAGLIRPETRLIFTESPGSLTFEVQDIPAICQLAHARGIPVALDNTWATPLHFKAFDHGVDVSIHAATKYVVGHADAMLGIINVNAAHHERIKKAAVALGHCAGSEECALGLRGLRTLAVRLARHQATALTLIEWLSARPEVRYVRYPAWPQDPGHGLWQRDFCGASGLFAIEMAPCTPEALAAFVDGLTLFGLGYS